MTLAHGMRWKRGGFTLIEMMIATAVSTVVSLVCMISIVEGMHLFQSNSSEMVARDKGSRALHRISNDIMASTSVSIYPSYPTATGSASTYGRVVVLTDTAGGTSAYYLYQPAVAGTSYAVNSGTNAGGIYYCANTSAGLSSSNDKLIVSSVQDLEFRSDINGSIRTGFKIGVYGYPTLLAGSKEPDLVRLTTSVTPRN